MVDEGRQQWGVIRLWVTVELDNCQGEMALTVVRLHSKLMSQNIDKSMAIIINHSSIDFQQWPAVEDNQWHSMDTQVLINIWQASEIHLSKPNLSTFGIVALVTSRPVHWRSFHLMIKLFFAIMYVVPTLLIRSEINLYSHDYTAANDAAKCTLKEF